MMCLRKPRKPLVPQLKRQAAASPRKQQLLSEIPAALTRARASTTHLGWRPWAPKGVSRPLPGPGGGFGPLCLGRWA